MVDVHIDIEGCPSSSQKQMISDQITALFQRICPSMPLRSKQLELIIASVIGADVNAQVYFTFPGYEDQKPPYPRSLVYASDCSIEPECDVLPCLNDIIYAGPDQRKPPC
jgi:hypothetical protein